MEAQAQEEEEEMVMQAGAGRGVQLVDAVTSPIDVAQQYVHTRHSPASAAISPAVDTGAFRETTVSPEERSQPRCPSVERREPSPEPATFIAAGPKKADIACFRDVTTTAPDVGVSMSKPRMGSAGWWGQALARTG